MLTHKFHSTMSKLSRLLTMAAITAAASQQGMTNLPNVSERPLPKYKGESPKCKTCVHFDTRPQCRVSMQMACENYSRKKRR